MVAIKFISEMNENWVKQVRNRLGVRIQVNCCRGYLEKHSIIIICIIVAIV